MNANPRNLCFGWWSLLCWLSLGMVLEALHGFKIGWYLEVTSEARRLQWSLAHAHGTLIALVNIAFAATVRAPDAAPNRLDTMLEALSASRAVTNRQSDLMPANPAEDAPLRDPGFPAPPPPRAEAAPVTRKPAAAPPVRRVSAAARVSSAG